MQQHYLPQGAYLKFFEIPAQPGKVYFYQRGKEIIVVGTHNVAKEKNLYSFTDKGGKLNAQVETGLAEFEGKVLPLMTNLNVARKTFEIGMPERDLLMTFVSLQAVRTPTFRRMLKHIWARFAQTMMQAYASRKEALAGLCERATKAGYMKGAPQVPLDDLREFLLDETRYTVEAEGDSFLGQQFELQDEIFRAICLKWPFLFVCDDETFITSDHPVLLLGNPEVSPFYRGGFLLSNILLPIGKNVCLGLDTGRTPMDIVSRDQRFSVPVMRISSAEVRQINKLTIGHAENYLFASVENDKIKELFDKTTRPTRVHFQSPFTRPKDQ